MSDQKTEKPTQKKLRDARKKGQVFKSKDILQALLFLTAVGVISSGGSAFFSEAKKLIADSLRPALLTGQLRTDEILHHFGEAWVRPMILAAAFASLLAIVAAAGTFVQVRALFAAEAVKPKFERLNPVKGFQNIFFKSRTYLELLKNLIKFSVLGVLTYMAVRSSLRDIILSARASPLTAGQIGVSLMFGILFKVGIAFLILGMADFLLQRKLYWKDLMMSKEEIRKEHKEDEGDPHIRHMRRHMHQQLLAHGMVQKVPKADVVVVNPIHLAIAIEYEEQSMNAPVVSAKGQETMAARIIELARSSEVPVVENIPLAHSLFEVEVGTEIPEDLYEAVAEILNWVYQLAQAAEA